MDMARRGGELKKFLEHLYIHIIYMYKLYRYRRNILLKDLLFYERRKI